MTDVKIKRVYEPAEPTDGFRVLIDRLWPRGVRKEDMHYDLWAKEVSPSSHLRIWYHADMAGRWGGFRKQYTEELEDSPLARDFVAGIRDKPVVTLLYASKNERENHALVLQDFLRKALGEQN